MAYITVDDLDISPAVLQQLTDDAASGYPDESKIDAAIANAQADVDGYCGKRFTVPFATPPQLVITLTIRLAKYNLYSRRDEIPPSVDALHKDALKILADISLGKATLGIEPKPAGNPEEVGGVISGPERIFTRDKMGGF